MENNADVVDTNTQSVGQLKHFFQKLSSSNLQAGVSDGSPPKTKPPDIAPKPVLSKTRSNSLPAQSEQSPLKTGSLPKQTSLPQSNEVPVNGTHVENDKHVVLNNEVGELGQNGGQEEHEEHVNGDNEDNEDDEDENGWGSEFDSESDIDQPACNKRESRIIFDSLDGIPEMDFLDQKKKKLYNIAKEILTTEVTYVQTLKLLHEVFFFKLDHECRGKGIIPKEALPEIFSNISTIHQFHRDFLLPKLEERMKNWNQTPRVGDIFNFLAPFLRMYAEYVKNFDQAMTSLGKWKVKSPKLASIIVEIQKTKECNNLTLEHHMLAPIQRVPRYKLLLTDYVSKLPEDSPDLPESKKALEIIASAANHANESMKKMERFKKMLEIQEKFGEGISIVTPSREFIMEGELVKMSQRNDQPMTRIIVLFNDAIYVCSKVAATGKYKVHQSAELLFARVEETEEDYSNHELMFRVRSKRQATHFLASSLEEKQKWVEVLKEAIVNVVNKHSTFGRATELLSENQLGKVAPLWVIDNQVSMCMDCNLEFTTLKRRHHCRACGRIFCGGCSSYRATLEYDNDKVCRVCLTCYKVLTKGDETKEHIKKPTKPRRKPSKKSVLADSLLNGFFNFRSDHTKTWAKRWCSLGVDFTIYVFKAKKDNKTQATIPLPGFDLEDESKLDGATEKTGSHVFKVSHPRFGWYMFDADSEETLKRWVEYIGYAIKAETPPDDLSSRPTSSTTSSIAE